MYKGRKETTHVEVGERNIHPHIEKNKYNNVNKWSQDLRYTNNVSKKKEKKKIQVIKKDTSNPHYISQKYQHSP